MSTYRPIVYLQGVLAELPTGDVSAIVLEQQASPTLATVGDGHFVVDTDSGDLVLRIGDFLYRYARKDQIQSFFGQLDFSNQRNSHWSMF